MEAYLLRYAGYQKEFSIYAKNYANGLRTHPSILGESIKYSFLNEGKRIRPVLALATAEFLGLEKEEILPFALALEMIHTYSLIHDDLPSMDNDDFRRGRPSNHKAFGEANAILAGDGLLNEAYAICFQVCKKGMSYIEASCYLNECAGVFGMIAGQSADLEFSKRENDCTEEELLYLYANKTGKLLLAPLLTASILKGRKYYNELERFGKLLGTLFQMTDDILDETGDFQELGKNTGKDKALNKCTCVRLFGLEGALERAKLCAENCHEILDRMEGDTSFFHTLVENVLRRKF